MLKRFSLWLLFAVVGALFPILVWAGVLAVAGKGFSLACLIGNGELLLVSSGLAVTAIGDLTEIKKKYRTAQLYCLFFCLVVVVMSTAGYTAIGLFNMWDADYSVRFATWGSVALFACTALSSALCILLARI